MKTLKNHWFLLCFQHLEVLGGLLRTLFSVFFDFRSYLRPYFRFPIVFSVCQIVFAFVFRFLIVFSVSSTDAFSMSVFTGAIRLHERIHGRDSAPRGSEIRGSPWKSAAPRITSELKVISRGIQGIRSPLSIYLLKIRPLRFNTCCIRKNAFAVSLSFSICLVVFLVFVYLFCISVSLRGSSEVLGGCFGRPCGCFGRPRGFLVGPRDVLGGAWGLLGGALRVLGRPQGVLGNLWGST